MTLPERLVLYDGQCGLCHKGVQFLLDHDPEARLMYAPLQGTTAESLRLRHPIIPKDIDTMVYVQALPDGAERVSLRSEAVLRIAAELPSPWRWARVLLIVPAFVRDVAYRFIASIRYRIWGQLDACRLPRPEERARFLE